MEFRSQKGATRHGYPYVQATTCAQQRDPSRRPTSGTPSPGIRRFSMAEMSRAQSVSERLLATYIICFIQVLQTNTCSRTITCIFPQPCLHAIMACTLNHTPSCSICNYTPVISYTSYANIRHATHSASQLNLCTKHAFGACPRDQSQAAGCSCQHFRHRDHTNCGVQCRTGTCVCTYTHDTVCSHTATASYFRGVIRGDKRCTALSASIDTRDSAPATCINLTSMTGLTATVVIMHVAVAVFARLSVFLSLSMRQLPSQPLEVVGRSGAIWLVCNMTKCKTTCCCQCNPSHFRDWRMSLN